MKWWNLVSVPTLTLTMVAIHPGQGEDRPVPNVRLTAVVQAYEPNAMHDTLEDGTIDYDASRLKILSPRRYSGDLAIFLDRPAATDSPWRTIDIKVRFKINARLLEEKSSVVFAGAAEDLEVVKPKETDH